MERSSKGYQILIISDFIGIKYFQFFTEVQVNIWKKIYIRVFVKTTLGIAFHHLDPTFINAYIVKLLQTWITLDKPF